MDENPFGMGTWASSPNHTFPRWPNAQCQALSPCAERKPLPVTQPHTNQTTATGLLSFNTCLSKYIWGFLFSDNSIWTLGIFFLYLFVGKIKEGQKLDFNPVSCCLDGLTHDKICGLDRNVRGMINYLKANLFIIVVFQHLAFKLMRVCQ